MSRSQEFFGPRISMNGIHPWLPPELNAGPLYSRAAREMEREVYAKEWDVPRDTVLVNFMTGESTTVGELDTAMYEARERRLQEELGVVTLGQEAVAGEFETVPGAGSVSIADATGELAVARVVGLPELQPV